MDVHDLFNSSTKLASLLEIIKALVQFPGLVSDEANNSAYINFILVHYEESQARIGLSEAMMCFIEIFNNIFLLSHVEVIVLNSVYNTNYSEDRKYSTTNLVQGPFSLRVGRWFLHGLRNDRFNGCRCLRSRSNLIVVSFFYVACLCDGFCLLYFLYLLTLH